MESTGYHVHFDETRVCIYVRQNGQENASGVVLRISFRRRSFKQRKEAQEQEQNEEQDEGCECKKNCVPEQSNDA